MKKKALVLMVVIICLFFGQACQKKQAAKALTAAQKMVSEQEPGKEEETSELKGAVKEEKKTYKSVSEFLDDYEKWVDAYYIPLAKEMVKLRSNPMKILSFEKENKETLEQAGQWLESWNSIEFENEPTEEELKRFQTIGERATKAAAGM